MHFTENITAKLARRIDFVAHGQKEYGVRLQPCGLPDRHDADFSTGQDDRTGTPFDIAVANNAHWIKTSIIKQVASLNSQ